MLRSQNHSLATFLVCVVTFAICAPTIAGAAANSSTERQTVVAAAPSLVLM